MTNNTRHLPPICYVPCESPEVKLNVWGAQCAGASSTCPGVHVCGAGAGHGYGDGNGNAMYTVLQTAWGRSFVIDSHPCTVQPCEYCGCGLDISYDEAWNCLGGSFTIRQVRCLPHVHLWRDMIFWLRGQKWSSISFSPARGKNKRLVDCAGIIRAFQRQCHRARAKGDE